MLSFSSKNDMNNILPFFKSVMIDDNDSKEVHEIFSALIYLYANNKLDKLVFPLTLIKRESPDFCILCYDKENSRGIEHTLSTLPDYKMAESELNKSPAGSKLEPDYYSPFIKLPKEKINSGIRQPEEHLKGKGYSGDRPEIEWAEIVKNAIHNKTSLLNKNHFKKFSTNELIVKGNSPAEICVDIEVALTYLKPHIENYLISPHELHFDKIHIISENTFVYDVLTNCEIVNFSRSILFPE
jgi:hypothetical protein